MVAKYCMNSVWESKEPCDGHGGGVWKSILKGRVEFWRYITFNLGSEEDIRFWEDICHGNIILMAEFKRIHPLAINRHGSIANNYVQNGGRSWALVLTRNLND